MDLFDCGSSKHSAASSLCFLRGVERLMNWCCRTSELLAERCATVELRSIVCRGIVFYMKCRLWRDFASCSYWHMHLNLHMMTFYMFRRIPILGFCGEGVILENIVISCVKIDSCSSKSSAKGRQAFVDESFCCWNCQF